MKKEFEVIETVRFSHMIEVEIPDDAEDAFEELAEEIAEEVNNSMYSEDLYGIASRFSEEFGTDNVTVTEDGSGDSEIECY